MADTLAETEAFAAFLNENEGKSLLRFLTCGSVDDGKSTLIGRLLYDSKKLFEDQLATLQSESLKFGTTDGDMDFALLVDGLVAEREQGITIDVAYRYFATDRRRFIVADTPGHEQYTRNMATGASNSDLAVLLVDAQQGHPHPDPAARLYRLAPRHPECGARRQQDRPHRLRRGALHRYPERVRRVRGAVQVRHRSSPSRSRRATATTSSSAARTRRGTADRRSSITSRP